jgi:plasmid stabilization system protein ParE
LALKQCLQYDEEAQHTLKGVKGHAKPKKSASIARDTEPQLPTRVASPVSNPEATTLPNLKLRIPSVIADNRRSLTHLKIILAVSLGIGGRMD